MEKMDGKTMDIVAENVGKLKELFPEAFTEGKVDFDVLKEVLGTFVDDRDERYSFNWNGKSNARMIAQTPSTGTLRPCKEESVDWDSTQNIFIEGDNLEVLKLLQKSYHKKVKMIYIDPPYNTGNDFVYKDNFKDNIKNYKEITGQVDGEGRNLSNNPETSGRYHTDWLNMMYPRLKLARNLLKDDGVIFISIDDNEVANLRKMCDEVFGEENFVAELKWKRKKQPSFLATHIAAVMEYILVFAKQKNCLEKLSIEGTSDSTKKVINISNNESERIFKPGVRVKIDKSGMIPKGRYTIKTMDIEYLDDVCYENGITTNEVRVVSKFLNTQSKIDSFIKDGLMFISKNKGLRRDVSQEEMGKRKSITDLLLADWGDNQDSDGEQLSLLGSSAFFDYTKPVALVKNFVKALLSEDAIILDFFAGSATTAHAVMQLNTEDNGKRKFIMVQLPETTDDKSEAFKAGYKTIAEISKERIRRSAAKIKEEDPEYDGDLGFKVFKLDSTNIKPWEVDFDLTERTLEDFISNIKTERREEDVLYEILLKYGLDLTLPITEHNIAGQKVFDIGMGALIICLSDAISLEVVEGIAKLKDELNPEIMRVVFKDSGFKDDVVKTNAVQILKQAGIVDVRSL